MALKKLKTHPYQIINYLWNDASLQHSLKYYGFLTTPQGVRGEYLIYWRMEMGRSDEGYKIGNMIPYVLIDFYGMQIPVDLERFKILAIKQEGQPYVNCNSVA